MRKIQKLNVEYCGFKDPETEDELLLEVLGLENAIKSAELRISMLRQGLHLNKMLKANLGEQGVTQNLETPKPENK